MIPSQCQALIFDMDGVLWHSSGIHAEAYRQTLLSEGLQVPDYTKLAGRRTDDVMRQLLESQRGSVDESLVKKLTLVKQKMAHQMLSESQPLAPGCSEVLSRLSNHYRLVLASSASKNNVGVFLSALGEKHLFEQVLNGESVDLAKPAPDMYLLALSKLNLPADVCLVLEDALHGIEAAKLAGISCIAITGTHSYEALENSHAIAVIDKLDDLCLK